MTGIIKLVHRADDPAGPFKTIKEVADFFHRDKDTIRRWGKRVGVPTHKMKLGDGTNPNAFVWLYTEADIEALDKYQQGINHQGGRPPKKKEI